MSKKTAREVEDWVREIARDETRSILYSEGVPASTPEKNEEERQIDRLKQELVEKGRILEIATYKKLVNKGWDASVSKTHWDIETRTDVMPWEEYRSDVFSGRIEKEIREVDVLAEQRINPADKTVLSSELIVAIECKYRERENWVFLLEPLVPPEFREEIVRAGGSVGLQGSISLFASLDLEKHLGTAKVAETITDESRRQLQGASHHSPVHLSHIAVKGYTVFSGTDSLRNACLKVLDIALFVNASHEFFLFEGTSKNVTRPAQHHWKIYPVVVFNGPLWSLEIKDGTVNLSRLSYVTYSVSRKDYEYFVDIVSWDYFDSYLTILDSELKRIERVGS